MGANAFGERYLKAKELMEKFRRPVVYVPPRRGQALHNQLNSQATLTPDQLLQGAAKSLCDEIKRRNELTQKWNAEVVKCNAALKQLFCPVDHRNAGIVSCPSSK